MKKVIHYEDLNEINAILRDGIDAEDDYRWVKAANTILEFIGSKPAVRMPNAGKKIVEDFIFSFLNKGDYLSAATLLFGRDKFDARPRSAQECFRVVRENAKCAIVGASSMGKSFNVAFYLLMDYLADMKFTKTRVGAVNQEHLKSNLFSDMVDAIESSVLDLQLESTLTTLEIKPKGMTAANHIIKGVTFPSGDERPTGRFKSLKPTRRPHPSEKWGPMGRVRIFLDEASNMSRGPYLDLSSPSASMSGPDRVKLIMAFNPEDVSHWTGQVCEPMAGWETINPDTDFEWVSKHDWHVLRLDALNSENVIHKREIYPGIQTYEGFLGYLSDGDNSARFWTFGRGYWPFNSQSKVIVPMHTIQSCKSDVIYPDGYKPCASVDIATSNDKVIFTLGRVGKSTGYEKRDGTRYLFSKDEGKSPRRMIVQVEQQFEIEAKSKTEELGEAIIDMAKRFDVSPDWLCLDSTAIGKGVFDYLSAAWGPVLGINWQRGATDYKFTGEDQEAPKDLYANIGTEMWFCTKFWLEYGILHFGRHVADEPLFKQMTTRQYRAHRGHSSKIMVETKDEYRKRGYSGSPDHADSLVMLTQLIRQRYGSLPSQLGLSPDTDEENYVSNDRKDVVLSAPSIFQVDSLLLDGEKESKQDYHEVTI